MEPTDKGVYCLTDKTFYYMEYGDLPTPQSCISRIIKTLVARDLLVWDVNANTGESTNSAKQYRVMSVREAEQEGLKLKPIYISNHVREQVENSKKEESKVRSAWSK